MSENKNNPALGDPYPKVKGIVYQILLWYTIPFQHITSRYSMR